MSFRLTPSDTTFYDLFAGSANIIVEGSRLLTRMLGADPATRGEVARAMTVLEHRADEATHAIIKRVNSSFITPFDREDIHDLATSLDDCMDLMESAADLIDVYELENLPKGISEQVGYLGRMAELTAVAMPGLRDMRNLNNYLVEINRLENEADRTHRRLLAKVMDENADNIIRVIKLKEVVDELESAADAFERVAHIIESIALKES